jgi:hypothetical protein
MERTSNKHRQPAPNYKVGDVVWVSLKDRTKGYKLRDRQTRATITEVVGSHSYRLDLPTLGHKVFHPDRLRLASLNPFPSQTVHDLQPPPVEINNEHEWEVEEIVKRQFKRDVEGFYVRWTGYKRTTWEPLENIRDTIAYDHFLARERLYGPIGDPLPRSSKRGG